MASINLPPISGEPVTSLAEDTLPPFAIRELNGSADDGVVQLTAPQYDSTIKSYPDATLFYFDEDDGETVTVGSSLELQQRLEDPVRVRRRHHRRGGSITRSVDSDQKIHIFDIQRTTENLFVWRDHAAYSSKTLRDGSISAPNPAMSTANDVSPAINVHGLPNTTPAPVTTVKDISRGALPTRERLSSAASSESPSVVFKGIDDVLQTACQGFENHIGGFAAFLDLTAGALRTAAEKTRDADTTPVENFLSGMKTVLVEAGQMGIELLRELEIEPQTSKRAQSDSSHGNPDDAASVRSPTQTASDTSSKRVSFVAPMLQPPVSPVKSAASPLPALSPAPMLPATTSYVDARDASSMSLAEPTRSSLNAAAPTKYSPADVLTFEPSKDKSNTSLMDIDAWNEDFAVRYPPLTSLRRAKTVGSLRGPTESDGLNESGDNPKSALARYPTIGQLEHRKRSHRATRLMASATHLRDQQLSQARREQLLHRYQSPTVEDASDIDETANSKAVFQNVSVPTFTEAQNGPPGAWPEPSAVQAAAESSGSFFNRMAGIGQSKPDTAQPRSPALSCRTTSPLADPFHPAVSALRRAKTVTASNPAARLNSPFDPMSGAPGPRDDIANRNRAAKQSIPNMLPQRSMTQHMPFHGLHHSAISPGALARQHDAQHRGAYGTPLFGRRQDPRAPQPMPGSFPYPPVPQSRYASDNDHFVRHMRSEPNFAAPAPRPTTDPGVSDCIKSLRAMGYGMTDANEDSRLPMYASATFGNISEAVEMIEEDRRAGKAILSRI